MKRPSRAAIRAASAFQAPMHDPPDKRKRPGGDAEAHSSRDKAETTQQRCEMQGTFSAGFLAMLAPDAVDAWLLPCERVEERRGPPPPTFDDVHEEARLWASWASLPERRSYMAAIWNVLPHYEQAAFLAAVGGEVVA